MGLPGLNPQTAAFDLQKHSADAFPSRSILDQLIYDAKEIDLSLLEKKHPTQITRFERVILIAHRLNLTLSTLSDENKTTLAIHVAWDELDILTPNELKFLSKQIEQMLSKQPSSIKTNSENPPSQASKKIREKQKDIITMQDLKGL